MSPAQYMTSAQPVQGSSMLRFGPPAKILTADLPVQSVASAVPVQNEGSAAPRQNVVYILKNKRPLVSPGQSLASIAPKQSVACVPKNKSPDEQINRVSLLNTERGSYAVERTSPAQDLGAQLTRNYHQSQATCTCTVVPDACPACRQNIGISINQQQGSAPKRMRSIETSSTMTTQQSGIEPPLCSAGEQYPIGAKDFWGNDDVYPPGHLSSVKSLQSDASAFADSGQSTRRSVNPTSSESALANENPPRNRHFHARSKPSLVAPLPLALDDSATDNSGQNPTDIVNVTSNVLEDNSWIKSLFEKGELSGTDDIDPLTEMALGDSIPNVTSLDDFLYSPKKSDTFLDKHTSN